MGIYLCPADGAASIPHSFGKFQAAFTSYLGVSGQDLYKQDGVLFLNSKIRLTDIGDGTSSTVLVGERPPSSDSDYGWWYAGWGQQKTGSLDSHLGVRELNFSPRAQDCPAGPYAYTPGDLRTICPAFHFWSWHPGGANFAFADGSVRFLSYDANSIMPALASRAGGEIVRVPD